MSAFAERWQDNYDLARETMPVQDAEDYAYRVLSPNECDELNKWIEERNDENNKHIS